MTADVNKVLIFLTEYKTRKELEERFKLSNTESYHLLKWLVKAKFAEEVNLPVSSGERTERNLNKTNRVWYYRTIVVKKKK